jgi:hypothetical protein
MTRSQRDKTVEAHADLILAEQHSLRTYAAHFETQMRRGKMRGLLCAGRRWLRPGSALRGSLRGLMPSLGNTLPILVTSDLGPPAT